MGEALADRRRALGYSVEDIVLKLKFGRHQLEALEQGRFDRLPGTTFVRGMIRNYARLLDLDPAPLLGQARSAARGDSETAIVLGKPIPFSDRPHRGNLAYAALSIVIAGVIGAVAWEWLAESAAGKRLTFVRPAQAPVEPAPVPVAVAGTTLAVSEPPAAAPAQDAVPSVEADGLRTQAGTHRIALRFERDSWVQIRARDGRVLLSQLNPAGTERVIEGRPPFDLVIGNARHVQLRYDDRPVDLAPHLRIEVARLTLE